MSKAIASYPEHQRPMVIARRMRQYDPKGANGCGVLAAKDYFDKHQNNKQVTAAMANLAPLPKKEEDDSNDD